MFCAHITACWLSSTNMCVPLEFCYSLRKTSMSLGWRESFFSLTVNSSYWLEANTSRAFIAWLDQLRAAKRQPTLTSINFKLSEQREWGENKLCVLVLVGARELVQMQLLLIIAYSFSKKFENWPAVSRLLLKKVTVQHKDEKTDGPY